jgi:hypothetical protein
LIQDGPEALRRVAHEIGDGHFARDQECNRSGEETEQKQAAPDGLENRADSEQ